MQLRMAIHTFILKNQKLETWICFTGFYLKNAFLYVFLISIPHNFDLKVDLYRWKRCK